MSDTPSSRQVIAIAPDFFCDGPYYLLTSASLGGSGLTPEQMADQIGRSERADIEQLLWDGVCIPLFFNGDCALDSKTLFVLGELTEQEERDWIARLAWKLKIPCGKFVLHCGGGDADELAHAISGRPPDPHYQIFQTIEVPPAEYLVEIFAYFSSMTVQQSLYEYDARWNLKEDEVRRQWYECNRPGCDDVGYIIRLTPLKTEPAFPKLVSEIGWCGEFEFRPVEV